MTGRAEGDRAVKSLKTLFLLAGSTVVATDVVTPTIAVPSEQSARLLPRAPDLTPQALVDEAKP